MKKVLKSAFHMVLVVSFMTAFVFTSLPAEARPVTEQEYAEIDQVARQFTQALEQGDGRLMLDLMPEKLLFSIAERSGLTTIYETEEIKDNLASIVGLALLSASFSNVKYDVRAIDLEETPSLKFGQMPMSFKDESSGRPKIVQSPAMALYDKSEGRWYLLRVDASNIDIIREVYPELANFEME